MNVETTNLQAATADLPLLPAGLERAVYSGQLAAELVDRRALNGAGDLLLSLIEVSRERFFTPPERIREIGRRTGERVCRRLAERLRRDWGVEEISVLPWAVFRTLVGQLSDGLGLGMLDLGTDEQSGLIRVRAWHWPFPEELEQGGYVYVMLEGFVTSVLEAVSPCPLEAVEAPQPGIGDDVCEFVVGAQPAVRLYLETHGGAARKGARPENGSEG
jgi:hypothetical protein